MKTCKKCQQEKENVEFHKHPAMRDGRDSTCKACRYLAACQRNQTMPAVAASDGQKACTRCKLVKSLDEFSRCRSNKDGKQYFCKQCNGAVKANPEFQRKIELAEERKREQMTASMLQWIQENPATFVEAKAVGLFPTVTLSVCCPSCKLVNWHEPERNQALS